MEHSNPNEYGNNGVSEVHELPETETPTETPTEAPLETTTLDSLRDSVFSPEDPKLATLLSDVVTEAGLHTPEIPVLSSIPEDGTIPENMDIAIVPLRTAVSPGAPRILIGVAISLVPTVNSVLENNKGADWLAKLTTRAFASKIRASIMPKEKGSAPFGVLPSTLHDYITVSRGGFDMTGFNLFAPLVVKFLRKRVPSIDKRLLKSCLESQAFADSVYGEKLSGDDWVAIIERIEAASKSKGADTAIFTEWKAKRDSVVYDDSATEEDPFNIDDLSGLV